MATKPFPVTVHPYPSKVKHACAYELGSGPARNALIFVGGLGDGPHTVPYIRTVAAKIEADSSLSYSVFEIRIRSSFCGFGWNNLAKDVQDISSLVKYLRGIGKEKVVLMGHSTGSQVCASSTLLFSVTRLLTKDRTASSIRTTRSTRTSPLMASFSRGRCLTGRPLLRTLARTRRTGWFVSPRG